MTPKYIPRIVNLEPNDYRLVRRYAEEKGLGARGFSAALRIIIREWQSFRLKIQSVSTPTDRPAS